MGTTRCWGAGMRVFGRRLSPTVITVVLMVLLAIGRRALSGWGPLEALLDPTPDGELIGDVVQTALWLAYRGLRRLGLPDMGIGRGCAPEA